MIWTRNKLTHREKLKRVNVFSFSLIPELDSSRYNLKLDDSNITVLNYNAKYSYETLSDLINYLEDIYCKNISAEFMHLEVRVKWSIWTEYMVKFNELWNGYKMM